VWTSIGLWETRKLTLAEATPLTLNNPDLLIASRTIARRIVALP
jgi:hypothetical protein